MEEELFNAVKLLREYCDGGTSCDECKIKNKVHCRYETMVHNNFENPLHDVYTLLPPFGWSEYNK